MENFDQPLEIGMAPGKNDGLMITQEVRQYWREISGWALFFAILLFICFGLVALMSLFMVFAGGTGGFISGLLVIAVYGVILFFPGYYYYLFSSQLRQALNTDNTELLDQAFINLKRFYRFVGIVVIVFISLFFLAFIIFGAVLFNSGFPRQ